MTGDEARSAESVRRTLGAWLDGTNDPPTGLVDDGWRQARWDELCDAIGKDPQTWLDVSLTVIEETPKTGARANHRSLNGRFPVPPVCVSNDPP